MRASITYVSTWQKRANFSFLRANVPINVPMFQLGVPRTKRRANFSIWRASLPKGVPIFQTFLLRNTKENFDTSILRKKFYIILGIIVIHIICIYISYINIVLYFTSILHDTLKKSVWNFLIIFFFFSFLLFSKK